MIKTELQHYLFPGLIFARNEPFAVTTVLGSCVSVCLWDPQLRAGGINHYLLPLWNNEGLQTPRYGNIAIPMLVEKMLDMGCKRQNLSAKVFGGSSMIESQSGLLNIGERNIALAEDALSEERIKVACRDVGGTLGRHVTFLTESGDVYVKKVKGRTPSP